MSRVAADVGIREYSDADERATLDLLMAALGGGPGGSRPSEFFRWKHLENPFGRSYMLVAETHGRIVGLRAFMQWEFASPSGRLRAVRAVDTATHPDHQGMGIFSTLTRRALSDLPDHADLVFNTPNEKSLPGYLKMGWRIAGRVPIHVQVRRPIRFARHVRSWKRPTQETTILNVGGIPASDALADPGIEGLLAERQPGEGIETVRDARYLRWRYGRAPLLGYRAIVRRERGRLRGLALFRVRPRGALVECTVSEVIVEPGNRVEAGRLLVGAARASAADHVTCSFPGGTAALSAAKRAGFIHAPGGMTLVVNPLAPDLVPSPLDLRSWALTVGDLEVF